MPRKLFPEFWPMFLVQPPYKRSCVDDYDRANDAARKLRPLILLFVMPGLPALRSGPTQMVALLLFTPVAAAVTLINRDQICVYVLPYCVK